MMSLPHCHHHQGQLPADRHHERPAVSWRPRVDQALNVCVEQYKCNDQSAGSKVFVYQME